MLAQAFGNLHAENHFNSACDLCGDTTAYFCAAESPVRSRTLVCSKCGLIYVSPQPSPAEVDEFNLNNPGDKGSLVWAPSGFLDERYLREQEGEVSWSSKIIDRFMDVEGKRILSLRCLSGALATNLTAKGAKVFGVDPFESNIRYATEVRGLSDALVIPMSRFHELKLPWDRPFDAIECLTIHVLAHVMYPRQLLSRIFDLLKPGGYLFLDEKDVLLPARHLNYFVLDSGRAHQYQFTRHTAERYVRSVGFELVECQIEDQRVSDFRHIRVVARKPESPTTVRAPQLIYNPPAGKDILRQLQKLEWSAWLRNNRHTINVRSRRLLKRIPGLRRAWRLSQQFLRH